MIAQSCSSFSLSPGVSILLNELFDFISPFHKVFLKSFFMMAILYCFPFCFCGVQKLGNFIGGSSLV